MKRRGLLLVVSGPSGAGKGTICDLFLANNPDVAVSVSATTRKPRDGEVEGKSYYFMSEEQFKAKIAAGEFYEYAHNYGNYYGTPRRFVEEKLASGQDVILEIDIKGAQQVKQQVPDATYIFILPPSLDELENRIINRGSETPESLGRRMASAREEMSFVDKYDYFIINDDLADAVYKMECIVTAEKQRVIQGGIYV